MARIVAVTACPTGIAHTFMAAEGLLQAAGNQHQIKVETHGSVGVQDPLQDADIAAADVVIIAADTHVDIERFAGKRLYTTTTEAAIRDGAGVIRTALNNAINTLATPEPPSGLNIVAITSCPTGIAHTFMAAEGLEQGAQSLGHQIKVETQGSVGAKNTLSSDDIANADLVIIAADTQVDKSRFVGKRLHETSTKAAIHDGAALVKEAIAQARAFSGTVVAGAPSATTPQSPTEASAPAPTPARPGAYKHLMTGVSYMIPFVVAGGLLIALGFFLGGIHAGEDVNKGKLGWALVNIGGKGGFALMVPILAGYISYSISDRPGLAPGMIGGMIAAQIGAGFLGGIAAGFLAGYCVKLMNEYIQLGRNLDGLKPVLILPLLGTLIVGLLMYYVVGQPVAYVLAAMTAWLKGLQGSSAIFLGLLLGAMMAFDMGGPVNKAAYAFATGLIVSHVYAPMAAVMAAGMTPPLGIALATLLFKNRFSADEREAGKATAVLGLSFITEGAIPFAARDPLRVIPALMLGSAAAGAISMVMGCELQVPHGGVFVLPIPNAVTHLAAYLLAIATGTVLSAVGLFVLKKPLEKAAV